MDVLSRRTLIFKFSFGDVQFKRIYKISRIFEVLSSGRKAFQSFRKRGASEIERITVESTLRHLEVDLSTTRTGKAPAR